MDMLSSYYQVTAGIINSCNENNTNLTENEFKWILLSNRFIAKNAEPDIKHAYHQLLYSPSKNKQTNPEFRNNCGTLAKYFRGLCKAENEKQDKQDDEGNTPTQLFCSPAA